MSAGQLIDVKTFGQSDCLRIDRDMYRLPLTESIEGTADRTPWYQFMFKQGAMHVINVPEEVMELFDETGFSGIFDIH